MQTTAARAGVGLVGVRERLRMQGGSLEICSGPGEGTVATVRVPLVGAG